MKYDVNDPGGSKFCEIGSAIGAIGSIAGGLIGSSSASKASDAQVQAAQIAADLGREGLDFQKETFDVNRADTDPFRASGTAALGTLNDLFIPGGQNVVQMHSRLNALRAQREILARSGQQPAPVQQPAPLTAEGNLARVRADRLLFLQNEGGGDGGGGAR